MTTRELIATVSAILAVVLIIGGITTAVTVYQFKAEDRISNMCTAPAFPTYDRNVTEYVCKLP